MRRKVALLIAGHLCGLLLYKIIKRKVKTFTKHIEDSRIAMRGYSRGCADVLEVTEAKSQQQIPDIPECVQRFLKAACSSTSDPPKSIILHQELYLKFVKEGDWVGPMKATQQVCTSAPAFVFSGSAPLSLLAWVQGYEMLIAGKGDAQWRMWGLIPLAANSGPLVDKAGRLRWLSEAVAFPDSLKPSPWLRWESIGNEDNSKYFLRF